MLLWGQKRNSHKILVEKPEVKKPLGRQRRKWTTIKQIIKLGWWDEDWIL